MHEYKRAEWGSEQGLPPSRIQAIAQTRDGYLWIGTVEGLLRFDGTRFVPILTDEQKPLRDILGLTVDKDGVLWVRAADTRIRKVQRDSISSPITLGTRLLGVVTMASAQKSGIYAADLHKSIIRISKDHVEALPIHSQSLLISISQANDGRLWIGTDRGLLSWMGGVLKPVVSLDVDKKINCLLSDSDGHVWVGTDDGLAYWDGNHLSRRPFPNPDMQHVQILTIMQDRDRNLWVGTSRGLLKYSAAAAEWVPIEPHVDAAPVTALMQDREGDIWFGTDSSLERLEGTPIVPVKVTDPSIGAGFGPLYVDQQGWVWFADVRGGLHWIQDGIVHTVLNDGLAADEVYSIDGQGDDIWVGRRRGGLTRLRPRHGRIDSRTWTTVDGLSQNSVYVVRVDAEETVWAGTLTGGLNKLQDGKFTHVDDRDGLPANDVSAIELGNRGEVWVGTSAGTCKIRGQRCTPLSPGSKHVAKDVLSLFEDAPHGLWIGTAKGLILATKNEERKVSLGAGSSLRILGLGLDMAGNLWIAGDHAVIRAAPSDLLASNPNSIRVYGNDDGLQSSEGVHRSRSLVKDGEGNLWMTTAHELAMIESNQAPLPLVIPHIEEIRADGVLLDSNNAKVMPGAKRLSFSFTGLDLHAPQRVRFRYRLDDFDKSWSNTVRDQTATYTNLAPGTYTFRLIASNESDSWSSEESTVRVVIEPGFWQRWYIRTTSAAFFLLLVALAYLARTRFLLAQANILADERLRERTRIARDVHDTLLQGFISSLMHLHVAEKQIASDSPLKQRFAFVLEGMERVIEEARLSVVGLRTPDSGHIGIESNLRDFFQEISDFGEAQVSLRSTGRPRRLKSAAREQICSIAKEAILNAVRHAGASNVQVEISWGWLRWSLSVTDDGCGIDAHTLEHGRAQHWGLVGMRERAKQLKGRLKIVSGPATGTKVSLSVPAVMAYRRLKESTERPEPM